MTSSSERGMIFGAESVRAILAGTKTQTRRVCRPQPELVPLDSLYGRPPGSHWWAFAKGQTMVELREMPSLGPFSKGTRLWVRETFYCDHFERGDYATRMGYVRTEDVPSREKREAMWRELTYYRADGEPDFEGDRAEWTSPLFMPRWASRITLEVTDVRVERVDAMTDADVYDEGFNGANGVGFGRAGFAVAWDALNAKRGFPWESSPWVWAVTFRRLETKGTIE